MWGLVVLVAYCLALSACSTQRQRYDEGSTIPWNKPEDWEEKPNVGAPFAW
jgi:hypothetical protein